MPAGLRNAVRRSGAVALARTEAHDEVAVEADVLSFEDEKGAVAPQRQAVRVLDRLAVVEAHAHDEMPGRGRLAFGRLQREAQLAAAGDDAGLLLELELDALGRPRRDRRHARRERGASGWPRRALVFLALLQQAGVDALGRELAVDGAGAAASRG